MHKRVHTYSAQTLSVEVWTTGGYLWSGFRRHGLDGGLGVCWVASLRWVVHTNIHTWHVKETHRHIKSNISGAQVCKNTHLMCCKCDAQTCRGTQAHWGTLGGKRASATTQTWTLYWRIDLNTLECLFLLSDVAGHILDLLSKFQAIISHFVFFFFFHSFVEPFIYVIATVYSVYDISICSLNAN